jgi:hypothetical protein
MWSTVDTLTLVNYIRTADFLTSNKLEQEYYILSHEQREKRRLGIRYNEKRKINQYKKKTQHERARCFSLSHFSLFSRTSSGQTHEMRPPRGLGAPPPPPSPHPRRIAGAEAVRQSQTAKGKGRSPAPKTPAQCEISARSQTGRRCGGRAAWRRNGRGSGSGRGTASSSA